MTDGFDWTAWAHGHIEALERENLRLAARVRELEEAQGELLGYVNGCPCAFMEAFMRAGED